MADPSAPGLFEGTAPYYSRYRRPYPTAVFDVLIERFALDTTTAVLDLGCGTGQLSLPLGARGIEVHGVDPDAEMLAEAIRCEQRTGPLGVAWHLGSDADLLRLHLPAVRVCTMGASFHWTDRDGLLAQLDMIIDAHGGVAVVSGSGSVFRKDDGTPPAWVAVAKSTVEELLGPERRAGGGTFRHPEDRHEVVLARSPFGKLSHHQFAVPDPMTIEEIVGLQLSMSYSSPAQLGDRLDRFRDLLTERLLELEPGGVFEGWTVADVILATR